MTGLMWFNLNDYQGPQRVSNTLIAAFPGLTGH